MAAQRVNMQGLATLAVVGMLTLLALGAALAAARMAGEEAHLSRESLRHHRLDGLYEAALLALLQGPELPRRCNPSSLQVTRCVLPWPNADQPEIRIHLHGSGQPDTLRVRLEAADASHAFAVHVTLRRVREGWRIVPGSWHDFSP